MNDLHVHVDRTVCAGTGLCVDLAPQTFAQDPDDGLVVLLERAVPSERGAAALSAQKTCPMAAIEVVEARSSAGPDN